MRKLLALSSALIISIIMFSPAVALEDKYEATTGRITGQIFIKGDGPIKGGTVFFFDEQSGPPPSHTKYWRVPTHAFSVDKNGRFNVALPEGNYYMGASHKLSGERLGPPQEGDLFFMSQDMNKNPKLHRVEKNQTLDLGIISEAEPFSREMFAHEGITSVEGTIRDGKGKPVEGMLVFAFSSPIMVGRPLFISDRTHKDGKYLLRLYEGGKYYLRARVNYGGGPPSPDQVMGIYGDGKPLTVETGDIKTGIDITVGLIGITE